MTELPELQRYSMETTEQMLAYEGRYDNTSIIMMIGEAIDLKWTHKGEETVSAAEKIVDAIWSLEVDVMNGGFGSFFGGSSARYTPMIVDALRSAGSPKAAEITQKAIDALELPELTEEAIERAIESGNLEMEDKLDKYGNAYADTRDEEDVMANLLAFIRANRESIRIP